jgi:hypothetical protein
MDDEISCLFVTAKAVYAEWTGVATSVERRRREAGAARARQHQTIECIHITLFSCVYDS